MTKFFGPLVRVRHDLSTAHYVVEVKQADDTWQEVKRLDEISDGFAWTNAQRHAQHIRSTLLERENVLPRTP